MALQKVTLTIPQSLHQEVKRLIKAGYYANFAELARAGIRKEIKELYMANPALALETDGLLYLRRLEEIRQIIREAGGINKTEEEALEDLRRIREEVWRERYAVGESALFERAQDDSVSGDRCCQRFEAD